MIWLPVSITLCAALWLVLLGYRLRGGDVLAGLEFWLHGAACVAVAAVSWLVWALFKG